MASKVLGKQEGGSRVGTQTVEMSIPSSGDPRGWFFFWSNQTFHQKTIHTVRLYVLRETAAYAVTMGSMVSSEIQKWLLVELNPETKDEV